MFPLSVEYFFKFSKAWDSPPPRQEACTLLGVVAKACNPSTWEAETGELQVRGQPQQVVRLSSTQ